MTDRQTKNLPGLHERRDPLLGPRLLRPKTGHRVKFGIALPLITDNDDADTTSIEVTCSEWADATHTTCAEIDNMRSTLWQVGGLRPVKGLGEYLVTD